ncbi:hypothetical protein FALBO_17286 [Fusarium albosuccineum]|uniref:Uncharacterized protein n=1 Tax=Fusarium albosuccineum TaxID=1237068 RepID=A0A8H4K4G3_9HYPO|nr:hypothetical protein FALBO_17286 [Fusarium albosuccineum]
MNDPVADANAIRQNYERWVAAVNRIQSPHDNARKQRLEHLERQIEDQIKFTRADTQGGINTQPTKLLVLEQAKLEREIESDREAYAEQLREANNQLADSLTGILPRLATPASSISPTGSSHAQAASIPTPTRTSPSDESNHSSDHAGGHMQLGDGLCLGDDNDPIQHEEPGIARDMTLIQQHETAYDQAPLSNTDQTNHPHTRRRSSTASMTASASHQAKRIRRDEGPVSLTSDRSIEFDDVFKDGRADVKYKIVQYPRSRDNWYILECKECPKHFRSGDVLRGAMTHLRSKDHRNYLLETIHLAVEKFGTLVLNCNRELADKNNAVCEQEYPRIQVPPASKANTNRPKRQRKKSYRWEAPTTYSQLRPDVVNPQPGDIFACWWPRRTQGVFYPVMILPWGCFERFRFARSLQHTGLHTTIPDCYEGAQRDDVSPRPWAAGYEDNGPLAHKRKFPVLFFGKINFPKKCEVGWVPLYDLKKFDENCPYTDCKDLVEEYLECKASHEKEEAERAEKLASRITGSGTPPTNFGISYAQQGIESQSHELSPVAATGPVVIQIDSDSDEEFDSDVPGENDESQSFLQNYSGLGRMGDDEVKAEE